MAQTKRSKAKVNKTPWHFWAVGILGLIWNLIGAFDFLMVQTKNPTYMSVFTSEQLAYFYGFPLWVIVAWGIAVWGGVFGAIFLLFKKRIAVWLFLASLVAMLVTMFQNYILSNGLQVVGDMVSMVFTGLILVIAVLLYVYSLAMVRKNVLK